MHSGCEHLARGCRLVVAGCVFCNFDSGFAIFVEKIVALVLSTFASCTVVVWGVFVGVVVSVLGRSVDALVPGADEGRGRPR